MGRAGLLMGVMILAEKELGWTHTSISCAATFECFKGENKRRTSRTKGTWQVHRGNPLSMTAHTTTYASFMMVCV